jgi:hypothetical protein
MSSVKDVLVNTVALVSIYKIKFILNSGKIKPGCPVGLSTYVQFYDWHFFSSNVHQKHMTFSVK